MTNDFETQREHATEDRWSVFDNAQILPGSSANDSGNCIRLGRQIPGTPWKALQRLGQGGVGEVFEVEHELLGRKAACKVLHVHNLLRRGLADRMEQEGRMLGSLRHANVVEAIDMGALADGRPYLVLERLEGRDLRSELKRLGVLSVPAALEIATHVLRGLSALHEANIVHRDIKLENLFLCADGHVEILDLGAAIRLGEDTDERAPSLGTPRTMAPEQYAGKTVDERTDLYAVGVVLYELLTGRGPFDDVSGIEALRYAHCYRAPEPPSRWAAQCIPAAVDALILRALAKSPADRFVSANAMAVDVAALRTASLADNASAVSAVSAHAPSSVTLPSLWQARHTWFSLLQAMLKPFLSPVGVASLALLALLVATLALGIAAGRRLPRIDVATWSVE